MSLSCYCFIVYFEYVLVYEKSSLQFDFLVRLASPGDGGLLVLRPLLLRLSLRLLLPAAKLVLESCSPLLLQVSITSPGFPEHQLCCFCFSFRHPVPTAFDSPCRLAGKASGRGRGSLSEAAFHEQRRARVADDWYGAGVSKTNTWVTNLCRLTNSCKCDVKLLPRRGGQNSGSC